MAKLIQQQNKKGLRLAIKAALTGKRQKTKKKKTEELIAIIISVAVVIIVFYV